MQSQSASFTVDELHAGMRLDAYLASQLPKFSRVAISRAIQSESVQVDGKSRKPSFKLRGGEVIEATVSTTSSPGPKPEKISLDIIYEDDVMAVINKPTGMVVHPAKGHWSGTLTSALAFHFQQLSNVGGPQRPGIVHRLDRDTSGVIAVAKTDEAHMLLAKQFEAREVEKEYYAICRGELDRDRDWIRSPIGAHPYQREKMAIRADHSTSREAETFFEVKNRWKGYFSIKVFPKTGRTHQIRVHLASIKCPVLCDPLYSGQRKLTAADLSPKRSASANDILFGRLALHAHRLRLRHPSTNESMEWQAPIPQSFLDLESHLAAL